MMLDFYKMTSAGHDFVLLDNRDLSLSSVLTPDNITDICDRGYGVGAVAIIVVEPSGKDADVRMRYFKADGTEAEPCGHGVACFTAFVDFLMESGMQQVQLETMTGTAVGTVNEDDTVSVILRPESDEQSLTAPALIIFRGQMILFCGDECGCGSCE